MGIELSDSIESKANRVWKQDNGGLGSEEDSSDLAKSILGVMAKSRAGAIYCKVKIGAENFMTEI